MYGEAEIEATEAALTAERERAIRAASAALAGAGTTDCANCGEEIPAARRKALPSATRCIGCQTKLAKPRQGRH